MHARRSARTAYGWPDRFFLPRGDISFASPIDAHEFCEPFNVSGGKLVPAEAIAMALLHEVFHRVLAWHRKTRPDSFARLTDALRRQESDGFRDVLFAFAANFPTPSIFRGDESVEQHFETRGYAATEWATEELLLLWLENQNPAYEPARPIVSDSELGAYYREVISTCRRFFAEEPPLGPGGENLIDLLLAPSRHAPHSVFAQLAYVASHWSDRFELDALGLLDRLGIPLAIDRERVRWQARGTGPGAAVLEPLRFGRPQAEEKRYSPDTDWMPRVVLLAKSVYVWLDQLARRYEREVRRLDQVPDEELTRLAACGFTGLWLIGVFERSRASRKIKRMRGDQEALASAYSLRSYEVAAELGGQHAWRGLYDRAWSHGIRLAADMVPNHVAIDADWVVRHPDWFLQTPVPPYPNYRFSGENLSEDERVGIFIEDGYWNHTDAAVVFERRDLWTGSHTFIYHGNDGTSMPWNDTAQLDYTKPEVRHAVIQTILHVARMFPIIRFDAAMTLAKKHYQRLWFPLLGQSSDVPSRAAFAMPQEELDRRMPEEFWREVVDTVAREAPGTLLLAEAFWLMEGYFVRTLGMHRVYNSAFMNMLKREENAKYRETIKNVLDFDPRILERFVNFMSNPDEETAMAQFGEGDKYFGVCVLMSTMPGLPMFGHGQIEGLKERYGMEYSRAKWDERPSEWLITRHEREIFPLLRRRHVYSGVACFALYDFATASGVNEDVFAYSNRAGDERALVLYHNKYAETRGWIHGSVPARGDDGALCTRTLAEALGLPGGDALVVFRDATGGLEYVRECGELAARGLNCELRAFQYHVFMDFRIVHDSAAAPWRSLAAELGGSGVPSVERSLLALRYRPLHEALTRAIAAADSGEPEEWVGAIARGLSTVCEREGRRGPSAQAAMARAVRLAHGLSARALPGDVGDTAEGRTLRVWIALEAALDVLASVEPEASRAALLGTTALDLPIANALRKAGGKPEVGGVEASAVMLLATLPERLEDALPATLDDPRGRALLHVHTTEGVEWLNQERYDEIVRLLVGRERVIGGPPSRENEAEDLIALGAASGYRTEELKALLRGRRATEDTIGQGESG